MTRLFPRTAFRSPFPLVAVCVGAALAALSAALPTSAQTTGNGFGLKDGDRVVFYGDSITDQRQYTVFVENYVLTRFPTLKIDFTHSGWGGDRVTGGGGGPIDLRLRRDVFPYKPTVMTVMLGMNDGGYRAFDDSLFTTFSTGYKHILDSVRTEFPNVRLTLIQPSPYDDVTRAPGFPGGYNATLLRYADFLQATAPAYSATVANLNAPVVAMLQQAKAMNAPLAEKILPDRVHPSPAGHLVMAESLLRAWNAPAVVSRVSLDAARAKLLTSENTKVSGLKNGASLVWDQVDAALPIALDPADPLVALVLKSSDFVTALDQETLMVRGLTPTTHYMITIDGAEIKDFTGEQLAQGINLATLDTPMTQQANTVLALTRKHNDQHFERWRTFQTSLTARKNAAIDAALPPLLAALDADEAKTVTAQRQAAQPVSHHYEIRPSVPLPTGPNLSLHKPYTASDPNTYNFGYGALTDGSWEANGLHTFATGDKDTFPKTATIDLGAAARISTVMVGVPAFGSTKTIAIGVSADGTTFIPVGSFVFSQRREQKHRFTFAAVNARYVRLTYPDHYEATVDYTPTFAFTTEAEVYAP